VRNKLLNNSRTRKKTFSEHRYNIFVHTNQKAISKNKKNSQRNFDKKELTGFPSNYKSNTESFQNSCIIDFVSR
jgi:hypothetical protein